MLLQVLAEKVTEMKIVGEAERLRSGDREVAGGASLAVGFRSL